MIEHVADMLCIVNNILCLEIVYCALYKGYSVIMTYSSIVYVI